MKQSSSRTVISLTIALSAFALGFTACVGAPPKKANLIEQVQQENAVGSKLAKKFEAKLHVVSDPVLDNYLSKVTNRLILSSADPRLAGTGIQMIQSRGSVWRSYSLPGRRVYLSAQLLQKMQSDNEVAALIAIELAHIQQRQVLDHLKQNASPNSATAIPAEEMEQVQNPDFFGPEGLFSYNGKEMDQTILSAVDLLYKAGFDSRGLVSAWETERKYADHSFYTVALLNDLIQNSREAVSSYPPLRNPIVRSQEFLEIQKRIQTL
jgi:predicted Zn-dependent protease